MRLDEIEETVNQISDRNGSWWPFLWLRPEKHVPLTLTRVISLSMLYGIPCSLLTTLAGAYVRAPSPPEALFTALAFPMLFLFSGTALVAPMWNRRAARLRARI